MSSIRIVAICGVSGLLAASVACGAKSDDGSGSPFDSPCASEEFVLAYEDREECISIPEACEVEDPCFDDACREAVYGMCDGGTGSSCGSVADVVYIGCG